MREIKFRCWRDGYMCSYFPNWRFLDNGLFWEEKDAVPERIGSGEPVLMQYTGLKDKNGVEIYEGDIVKWASDYSDGVSKVVWDNEDQEGAYPAFDLSPGVSDELNSFAYLYYENDGTMEVIGNIYENSELLK